MNLIQTAKMFSPEQVLEKFFYFNLKKLDKIIFF